VGGDAPVPDVCAMGMDEGYNVMLIIITVVITCLAVVANMYLIVHFQHPEDRNQAWFPKAIVLLALTVTELSILMLPLDVGNRNSCAEHVALTACSLTLPMRSLWYAVYMTMGLLVAVVIPFTIYYYEADSDRTTMQRWRDASLWVLLTDVVIGATVGVAYGLAGYVEYNVVELTSGVVPLSTDMSAVAGCISASGKVNSGFSCDATGSAAAPPTEEWNVRPTFPVYVMALGAVAGWFLFIVFAGVGVVAMPVDLIKAFIYRPRSILPKSEFLKQAREISVRSKELEDRSKALHRQQQSDGKTRKWKKEVKALGVELNSLEEEEAKLSELYPQSTDPDTAWAFTVMGYYFKGLCGVLGAVVSLCWILHIVLYMFVSPPVTPFLNDLFVELDGVFSLFGTVAFAMFCFYLLCCVMKGNMTLGLNLIVFTVHPMKLNGTLMSSFLFNTGLIQLCSVAVIQFCATAFDIYAKETAIAEIFGGEIKNLRGLKVLFVKNVFLWLFVVLALLTATVLGCTGIRKARQHNRDAAYAVG